MSLLQALKLSPPASLGSPPAPAKNEKLAQASEAWRRTHGQANERIAALKAAVKSHCADAHPELRQEIEKGLVKLDEVLDTVDHRLADSLATAAHAADETARKAELKSAKAILTEYINYVKSEQLVAHVDQNPFNVKTDLKGLLVAGLTSAAKAIG
jgi:NurA-like 5'-3' nuclease